MFGVPCQHGVRVGVCREPCLGALDHLDQFTVARCRLEGGFGFSVAHPGPGSLAVGVYGHGPSLLLA